MTAPISEMTARLQPSDIGMATATQAIDIGPPDEGQVLPPLPEPAQLPGWLTITIGGERHAIKKLAYRENQAWKKELEQTIQGLLPAFEKLDQAGKVQGAKAQDLEQVVHEALLMVDGAIDGALNLLIHYGKIDREQTETTIFDDEIIDNFLTVVRHAIPFDQLSRLLSTMGRGRRA
jgi:hypothetical protein